jgi:hypothetical protein
MLGRRRHSEAEAARLFIERAAGSQGRFKSLENPGPATDRFTEAEAKKGGRPRKLEVKRPSKTFLRRESDESF